MAPCDISRFSPLIDLNFFQESTSSIFGAQHEGFRNLVLHNCILVFDAEQAYLKLQVINLKNKEVIVNPKPQTLEKNWFFENPKP